MVVDIHVSDIAYPNGVPDERERSRLSAAGQLLPEPIFGRAADGHALGRVKGEAGLSFGAALHILRRRRLIFGLCLTVIPILALVALERAVPRYTAAATVLFEPGAYAARELQSVLRTDPTTEPVMSSQAEIVRGLPIAARVAAEFRLFDRPEFNAMLRRPSFLARLSALWQPETGANEADVRNAVEMAVRDATSATTAKASRVIEVAFVSQDRALAADAANAVARLYVQDQLDAKIQAGHRANLWLDGRAAELRREVLAAESRIAAFRAANGLARGVQAGLETERASRLSADLIQARNEAAQAEARLDGARGRSGAALQAAIAPSVGAIRLHQDQLSAQLQSLATRFGPNHPEAIAAHSQLAGLQRSVGAEIGRAAAAAEAELRVSRTRVAGLEQVFSREQATLTLNDQAQVSLNVMERDADASRTLLAAVLERIQQTVQQTAIEMPDARLISAALPPSLPSYPRRLPLLAAACVFAVLFGLFLAYLAEVSDSTFQSGDGVRKRLGLSCFALIPEVGRRQLGGARIDEYAAQRPLSPFAEQLRALRAALWLGPTGRGQDHGRAVARAHRRNGRGARGGGRLRHPATVARPAVARRR